MPIAKFQMPDGRIGRFEVPEGTSPEQAQSMIASHLNSQDGQGGPVPPIPPNNPPNRPLQVEPPNWFERQLAKMPDILSPKAESIGRGFAMGAADPSVGLAQLAANVVGQGQGINNAIQQKEAKYQAQRKASGREGMDLARTAGNIAITAPLTPAGGGYGTAALTGAAYGGSNPVTEGDYWAEKGKQTAYGAAGGVAGNAVSQGLARLLRPNAVERVAQLRAEGVNPTIGQALGGWAGRMEEKAQSLPIMGDAITAARESARDQFNRATINKVLKPIGESTDEIGQAGIKQAGDKLSAAFDDALAKVNGIKLDPKFQSDISNLRSLSTGLEPRFQQQFNKLIDEKILGKASPNGGMLGETFQNAYSDLGKEASRFAGLESSGARDYGTAVKQLQNLLSESAERTSSPEAQKALKAAREGWANLVRVERAGTAAKGTEGIFTPGQLINAIRQSDTSVRDRATARGTALMQDWATQGQKVLGNNYPDSGTAGRLALGLGSLASGAISPAIPASLAGGAAAYLPPLQRLAVGSVASRPEGTKQLSKLLRQNPQLFNLLGAATAQGVNQ